MGHPLLLNGKQKRWLRRNKGSGHPSNLLFFDTETKAERRNETVGAEYHSIRLGVAIAVRLEKGIISRRKVCRFTTTDEFWSFVSERCHQRLPLWAFAHNLPFDLSILGFWKRLNNRLFGFSKDEIDFQPGVLKDGDTRKFQGLFIDSDPPTVIGVHNSRGQRINFVDSLNYWRLPLSKLGDSIGVAKLGMPVWEADDSDWFDYCERDVEVLEQSILKLIDWHTAHDLGQWGFTQAQMSMQAYRHRFMPVGIELHENAPVKQLERASYYGGRLELFYRGKVREKVYCLDVNSMYPHLMRERSYPRELIASSCEGKIVDLTPESLTAEHIAEVLIDSDTETFPLRTKAGTIYPRGRYWTTLAGPELTRAKSTGSVVCVGRWALYSLRNLFREYVDFFYSQRQLARQSGNSVEDLFCKIFMNSLYGKFGQKTPAWSDCPDSLVPGDEGCTTLNRNQLDAIGAFEAVLAGNQWEWFDADSGEEWTLRKVGHHWQIKTERKEHPKAFPAIAAFVTAYGREMVNHLRHVAGVENTYYVVTDAVFVNQNGFDRLDSSGWVDPAKLGKLSVDAESDEAEFTAIHHYEVGQKVKFGSRKSKAIDLGNGRVKETHFEGLASLIKRPADGTVKIYDVEKQFKREYTRGTIKPDGWIEPLELCDP